MSVEFGLALSRHVLLFLVLIVCSYSDLVRNRVPNWCTVPAMTIGIVLAYWRDALTRGNPCLLDACMGLAFGGGLFLILFLLGGMGGGDVKLMGAVGALEGFRFTIWAMLYVALVGAAMAISLLIWHGKLWIGLKQSVRALWPQRTRVQSNALAGLSVPYGFAISAGVIWAWLLQVYS